MVMMVIITDGQENASREYSSHRVKELIEKHEKSEAWQFIYLGADLSSFGCRYLGYKTQGIVE